MSHIWQAIFENDYYHHLQEIYTKIQVNN